MASEKLFFIHGIGKDSVGLIGKITDPIAALKGNIVDVRQDVMHGLFIIHLVVDLAESSLTEESLRDELVKISNSTGLKMQVEDYSSVPRDPQIKNLLIILAGYDKPGIISTVTKTVSDYNINIEFSNVVAREGIFLMELLTDIRHCTLPISNLRNVLTDKMKNLGIHSMYQEHDVFNKKKRIVVFDLSSSFISNDIISEIINQVRVDKKDFNALYDTDNEITSLKNAANRIEDLPVEVVQSLMKSIEIESTTTELIQTLKTMGYRIIIISRAFNFFTNYLKEKLHIDYAFGCDLQANDDLKVLTSDIDESFFAVSNRDSIINSVKKQENVSDEDVVIVNDTEAETLGIKVQFSMKEMLNYYNQHILSKDNLIGLLGSFGNPKLK